MSIEVITSLDNFQMKKKKKSTAADTVFQPQRRNNDKETKNVQVLSRVVSQHRK